MKHRSRNLRVLLLGMTLLVLLVSSACAGGSTSPTKSTTTPPSNAHSTQDTQPGGNTGPSPFAAAFPPSTPLTCSQSQSSAFVTTQHTQFLLKGTPLKFYGYTFYPALVGGAAAWHKENFTQYIDSILAMGAAARQNLIRPTDFWDKNYKTSTEENRIIWQNMDYLVCTASRRGIFIDMDISAFEWFLQSQGHDTYDMTAWKAFIDAVGKHYNNQPAIAFYSILGEPKAPKTGADMNTLINFYRATTDALYAADSHHLITAGGFNHMEDESPQLPWWRNIYSLPHNDIAAFKTYSQKDLEFIPTISEFARTIDKPALNEEFGMPQKMGDATSTGALYNSIQTSRSAFFENVYSRGEVNGVVGFIFWNLGCEMKSSGYEVSPKTPAVWQVIQKHAAVKSAVSNRLMC